ncbi:MAG TPA: calcium-binding protein [Tepidisphaeraceae bacterium]|jgi:Ca2+-binding RTX toxin-like protein|nr:calcium-binding protein [Tepidisphaeraceae bacterium]
MLREHFESLEQRQLLAVTAAFIPGAGILTIFGDAANNSIVVSRDAAGKILVNNGAVNVLGATPTVANTALIQIFGLGGNDNLSLNEANGALPRAFLFGDGGNDTLTGGSGNDQLFGQSGSDQLLGKGGFDFLFGGSENDILTGGDADDQVFGQAGNDRMIWNPGDDTDLNEGGDGVDTVEVNGGNGAEVFSVVPNGTRVRFDRLDPAPFSIDIGTSENLVLNANGGDDTFTASNGLATLISITADGGAGNDTFTGGDGADFLLGGDGNDLINGGRGNDTALLGAGDDTFVWNPGDGNDIVEGQDGHDEMLFNGANINEKIELSANGGRLRFTRDVANIVMDTNDVEKVTFTARGGADLITINDLSATDVTEVSLNLESSPGSGTGDGAADNVIVNATNGDDTAVVNGAGTSYTVSGLAAVVSVIGSEGAIDQLTVDGKGGNDVLNASPLPDGVVKLTLNGEAGNDAINGSQGADMLIGGDGSDIFIGGRGDDLALMGSDNDTFVWNPGDGNDVIEGQDGFDTMAFNGANINEKFDFSANGSRLRFTRDVANIVMDTNNVEQINLNAQAGADQISIHDLTGTGVTNINLNLGASPFGGGDASTDTVIIDGTAGADNILVASNVSGGVKVGGLGTAVNISFPDPDDQLIINALGGDDKVDASGLTAGVLGLTVNGGSGADVLIGSQGDDLINGGQGNDTALLGAGDDTFVWNPGDGSDVIEGQAGFDTMQFNGANINEQINLSANGPRLRFTRDVAAITMDTDGVEVVNFNALGGADTINVHDLGGTDVSEVNLNLLSSAQTGDGAIDTVSVDGTDGADVAVVAGDASGVSVTGLAAAVNIIGAEAANDRLVINAAAGDDVVQASGLAAGGIQFQGNGGDGDDILMGGDGNDTLTGGAGDDVLIGGPGLDVLDGAPGNDVIIQD